MDTNFIVSLVFNGASAGFGLYVVKKLWNKDKWKQTCINTGKFLSAIGRKKFGKGFWEKIETFIQDRLASAYNGLNEGLDFDNDK